MLISRITAPQSIRVSLMRDTTRATPARHRAAGTRSTPEFVREAQCASCGTRYPCTLRTRAGQAGHLKIDRPQKYSSVCPTLYGLLPQTSCGERVAQACRDRTGRPNIVGDGDRMDV